MQPKTDQYGLLNKFQLKGKNMRQQTQEIVMKKKKEIWEIECELSNHSLENLVKMHWKEKLEIFGFIS